MAKKKTSTGLEVNYVRTDEKKLKKTISMADVRKDEGKVRSVKWNNTQNTGAQGTSSPVSDDRTSRIDNVRDRYDAVKKRRAEIEKQFNRIDYGYENHDLSADGMAMSRAQVLEDALEKLTAEEERLKYLGAGYKETGNKFTDFLTQAKANYDLGRLGQDKAKAYAEYADNPTEEAETNARALSLLEQRFATQFDDVLDDNGAVLPWLSKSAAGYIPQAIDQAKGTLKGAVIGGLATAPSLNPFVIATGMKTGGAIGGGATMYDVVRGSAIESMLNAGIDLETAKKAAQNEALLSSLIESAELGVDFTTFGAGKWLNIIGSYAQNIGRESLEEASQQGISIANLRRLQAGEDPSLLGLAKDTLGVYRDAITGEDIDARNEMLEAGKEGGKIAAVMGGVNRVGGAALNRAIYGDTAISEDNDPRAALLQTEEKQPVQVQQTASKTENAEKGVLSDSGGISEEGVKLDSEEEIVAQRPQANSDDAVMEFARETVAKREEHQQADREAIEYNVRKATGYGEQGVKAVADIVEKTNADTVEIDRAFRTAYETGLTGIERSKVELVNEIQEKAYTAGYLDYTAEMEKLKSTQAMVRKDGGLFPDDKKLYKNLPTQTYNSLNRIGKALGTAIVMDDTLTEQQQGYYNAKDGSIHISTNVGNAVMEVFKHEVTHRMQELAPTEYAAFRSFVYESLNEGRMSSTTLAEAKRAQYSSMGVNEDISGSIDEVVAAFTEELFADEQKLHDFIAEVTGDETKRSWAQKFFDIIREVIDKVKGALRKGDTSIADSIKQLEKAEQMWKDAIKASVQNVHNTQSNQAQKNTADGDVKYDLNGTDFQEDKYFARQIDKWDELKDGMRIKVGVVHETSALHKVGLPAERVFFDVGKIKKAMNDHNDHLTIDVLKDIPDLLNDPVVITEYRGAINTVNVYGNLFVGNTPVVVGIVMRLDSDNNSIINNIRTVHARNNFAKQITDDAVLYLNENKKKTHKWFHDCGNLNVPLAGTRFGVIRIISFKNEKVKYSLKDTAGRELTKEQQEFYADSKILDKDGNLLVLYHGTGADFTVFDTKRAGQNYDEWSEYGKGIYLTPSTKLAKYYAENARGSKTKQMELYANIENPFNVTKAVEFDIDDLAEKYGLTEFDVSFLKRAGYRLTDFLRDHNEDITAYLTSKGHDGLWDMERGKATQVVAYKENQVKNVDNKNPTSDPDIRFSLKDSNGYNLSEAQAEYFKDSKVRDRNGNLLRVFHATNAEFYTFDKEKIGEANGTSFGRGFYFATYRDLAGDYGNKMDEYYLNITNPYQYYSSDKDYIVDMLEKSGYKYDKEFVENYDYGWLEDDDLMDVFLPHAVKGANAYSVFSDMLQKAGFDGVWAGSEIVAFEPEQIKLTSNKKPTSDPDIRYSLKASNGYKLSEAQAEYFKDSKVRDENGNLLVMYHGTPNASFTEFHSSSYFTQNKEYAKNYVHVAASSNGVKKNNSNPDVYEVYLNITKPFDTRNPKERKIFENEFYRKWGNGAPLAESGLPDWTDGDDLQEFIEENEYDYDGLILDEGGTGGYGDEVKSRGLSYVIFHPEQVKNVDNKNPTDNPDIRFSLKEDKDILKENAKLKEINAALKNQFKVTKFAKVDKKALERFTKQLLKDYSSQADAGETRLMLDGLYQYMASGENGESAVWEEVYQQAREIAEDVLHKSVEVDDEMYREYADLRKYLRETPISIAAEDVADIDGVESLQEFRKKYWGRIRLSNDGIRIDDIYSELAAEYPALFDAETETHPGVQLARIGQVLDEMQPTEYNPFKSHIGQMADLMAYDIVDRFFDLPQAKPTFADKAEQKLTETRIREGRKLEKLREQKNDRIKELITEGRRKVKDAQQKEREKRIKAVDELKDKQKQREKKMSEKRQATILRKRIEKHTKALSDKLLNPTDKRHIPEALRKTVAALLESINLESQYTIGEDGKRHKSSEGAPVKRSQLFNKLQEEYAKISENGEMVVDPALIGGEGVQSLFTQAMAMGNTKIADMTAAELDVLWQVIRAVEHSISTANKVLSNAKYQATSEWANDILAESGTRRAMKGKGMEKLRIDLENPYTFFSHYGESGKAIFRMLRDAQDKQQIMTNYIAEEVAKVVDDKTVKKLEKDIHEFKTERGDKLTLTTAHVMEVYLLSKREQAQGHLLKGGIVQPAIESKKIKRGTDSILLSFDDLQNIIGKLTQTQRNIADALQKLTGTTLAEYGNEASMKAYGYKKFTGENYWTIKSAKEGIHSNIEKGAGNSRSIKNIGLAKNVMPHASNPLDINGIFKTFASHSADMIDYAAWLCPMEDANRLYNFSFRDEMGNQTGKTMKGLLDRVGGIGAQEYWHNLMEDIQNGIETKNDTIFAKAFDKLAGNAKAAAVGANIRVIIQQPTAIMRAAMVLSPTDMMKGALTGGGWKTALKHSAIAQRKDAGGFDISSPMGMYETLFDGRTAGRKLNDAMMWGAGKADAITWGRIWNACEHNVKHNQPELQTGSKEFYKAVDALFTEVIDQSQVVDGILQRSQAMRSSNAVVKQMTSFMGEPTMALNMCIRSYNAWRNQTDKQNRKAAFKKLSRSITVLVITNAFNALAQSFVDAWRDDDEDKGYWSRWYTAFFGITGEEDSAAEKALSVLFQGNLASNINLLNNVPLAKDVVSIMSGYDVTRMDADVMSDVLKAGQKFFDSITTDGKYTKPYGIKELALNVTKACGISALNILRDVWGIARSYAVATDDVMMQYQMEKAILKVGNEKNNSAFVNILYRAYNTNQEMYQAIYDDMVSNGIDADKIATGMESRMKKAQGVKKVSELEERYLSPTQEKEYKQKNKIISNTNLWKSATDGAKNKIEDYLYDIVMDKDSDFVKKVEAAAEADIDDTEYLLYKLALEMYDKPTENGKYGTFTQEEAENAISELDGLTDAQRAYLWQNTNEGWNEKKNPWK